MIDTRLPLMVQQPNILAALDAGTTAATNQNALMRAVEGQNLFRQHGAGAMQGNQNALAAIAGFDPVMAQGMDMNRQENARADARLGLDRERLELTRTQTALAVKNAQDKADAESQVRMMERAFRAADMGMRTGDEAAVRQALAMFGVEDLPVDEGMAYAAQFVAGGIEGLAERYKPREADYVTLNDQLVDRNAPGGPAVVPVAGMDPKPARDPAAELKIQRLMETRLPNGSYLTREQAIGIADGRFVVTQLGELMDTATGQIVDSTMPQGQLGVTPAPTVPVTPELPPTRAALPDDLVDYRGAFGAEGLVTNLVNGLTDFATGERAFEEQGRARTALANLKTRTLTTLASASVAGRPSNYVMQMFEENVAQPTLMGGPAAALDTAQQTMSFLDAMIAENRAVLGSRVDAQTRSTARRSIEALEGLRQDYEIVVNGLSRQTEQLPPAVGDAPPPEAANHPEVRRVMEQNDLTLEELWPHLSPEARTKLGFPINGSVQPAPAPRAPSAQERRRSQ